MRLERPNDFLLVEKEFTLLNYALARGRRMVRYSAGALEVRREGYAPALFASGIVGIMGTKSNGVGR